MGSEVGGEGEREGEQVRNSRFEKLGHGNHSSVFSVWLILSGSINYPSLFNAQLVLSGFLTSLENYKRRAYL